MLKYLMNHIRAVGKNTGGVKMRVDEILSIADSLKENEISEELKMHWLNEVEGRVHCEINKFPAENFEKISTTLHELSIPMPYSKIYLTYLLAMMSFASKEYDLYADIYMKYEREFSDYAKLCLRER